MGIDKKLFIFDLDGTLLDSTNQIISSVELARAEMCLAPAEISFLKDKIGLPAAELFSDLDLTNDEKNKSVEIFRKYLKNTRLEPSNVFREVFALLKLLREQGVQICVATNKPTDLAKQALEDTEIVHFFDLVLGSDGLPAKPDPAIIISCLLHFQAKPEQAVMIGDRCEDMMAANFADVLGIGVVQGVHSAAQLADAGAKRVFNDISEILMQMKKGVDF